MVSQVVYKEIMATRCQVQSTQTDFDYPEFRFKTFIQSLLYPIVQSANLKKMNSTSYIIRNPSGKRAQIIRSG
jgi:hypothetical protein